MAAHRRVDQPKTPEFFWFSFLTSFMIQKRSIVLFEPSLADPEKLFSQSNERTEGI